MRVWFQARSIAVLSAAACLPLSGCVMVGDPHACDHCCQPADFSASTGTLGVECGPSAGGYADAPALLDSADGRRFPCAGLPSSVLTRPIALPVPRFLAAWHAHQTPPAAPYPRFHPLPVRPMFAQPAGPSDLPYLSHPPLESSAPLSPGDVRYGAID